MDLRWAPTIILGKVREKMNSPPQKPTNKSRRSREFLTEDEINKLMQAARKIGRHGHRDSTMILIAFRHGLRVSELISLKWQQIDLDAARLYVVRRKSGTNATHPLYGPEMRALRKLMRDYPESDYVFITERKAPMISSTFRKLFMRAGQLAQLPFPVHPHMLRHATGYKLANDGRDTRAIQDYLGHKNIQHTVKYTEITPHRFKDFWND